MACNLHIDAKIHSITRQPIEFNHSTCDSVTNDEDEYGCCTIGMAKRKP